MTSTTTSCAPITFTYSICCALGQDRSKPVSILYTAHAPVVCSLVHMHIPCTSFLPCSASERAGVEYVVAQVGAIAHGCKKVRLIMIYFDVRLGVVVVATPLSRVVCLLPRVGPEHVRSCNCLRVCLAACHGGSIAVCVLQSGGVAVAVGVFD